MRYTSLSAASVSLVAACALTGCSSYAAAEGTGSVANAASNAVSTETSSPTASATAASQATLASRSASLSPSAQSTQDAASASAAEQPASAPASETATGPSTNTTTPSETPAAQSGDAEPQSTAPADSEGAPSAKSGGSKALSTEQATPRYLYRGAPTLTLECAENGKGVIEQSSTSVAVDASCTHVVISANNVVLYGGDLESLRVSGNYVVANIGVLDTLVITGDSAAIIYSGERPESIKNRGVGNVIAPG